MTTILIDENTQDGRELIEFLRKKKSVRILDETEEKDWWTIISEEEKNAIEEGLSDIEMGKTKSYNEIKKRYANWL